MKIRKQAKYRGGPSEILESIEFEGYEIKSLKHGNTGHVLYRFPSAAHDWEGCWTMDLETAKKGVSKYNSRQGKAGSAQG
jgi:hypothetical protein